MLCSVTVCSFPFSLSLSTASKLGTFRLKDKQATENTVGEMQKRQLNITRAGKTENV